ncbi:MAG TPA: DNA cytosine methyltransferase [Myxococcales bacterium]|nr:DNA cytosine methyltransferase [Myxococcales bacterium]
MTLRMLDLFSGFGGASAAMVESEGWEVVRIENNPLLGDRPHTQLRDVTEWLDWIEPLGVFDLVWASPPCTDFSRGFDAPMPTARRNGEEYEPDLSLMLAAKEIIEHLSPKWWVIENVGGACEWFNPILGKPTQIIQSFYLWGKFPFIAMPVDWRHSKFDGDTWSSDPLRANRRALVPFQVSDSLREGVETQRTLGAWT